MYGCGLSGSEAYLAGARVSDSTDVPFPDNVVETDCTIPVAAMQWGINTAPTRLGNNDVSVYQTPYVGDLDGDGHVEIVVAKSFKSGGYNYSSSWCYAANGFHVFDMRNNSSKIITTPAFSTGAKGQIGLARPNASLPGYIVLAAMDGYLYAYDKAGNLKWVTLTPTGRSNSPYTTYNVPDNGSGSGFKSANILFADFNGDGRAEIVTGDRIFDLETGRLLLDCQFLAGRRLWYPIVSVVDVNKDGKPELVWGGNVYSINITSRTGTAGNTFSLMKQVSNAPLPNLQVTATAPADFDLDGQVDILAHSANQFYIYNPLTGAIKARRTLTSSQNGEGTPFVGDIDGDQYPEIMYGESASPNFHISAWTIYKAGSPPNPTPQLKWQKQTTDESRSTGLTLFDFDQNGKYEILYRDHDLLRIFDGTSQATMATPVASIPCVSGTQSEYPITADVDNDGAAEIIVTGGPKGNDTQMGYLYIFNPSPGTRWAPARKVWNQYSYNVVNINGDLTVPSRMFDIATFMAGPDSVMGTKDDIHPYNGFLKQSTMIDRYGNMVRYAPDVKFLNRPAFRYNVVSDSLQIRFSVANAGQAASHSPLYIGVYRNEVSTTGRILVDSIMVSILPDTILGMRTISIPRFTSSFPSDSRLILCLNDRGLARYEQAECNTDNNSVEVKVSDFLPPGNDTRTVQQYHWTEMDVLANDSLPDSFFAGAFSLLDSVVRHPVAGSLSVTGRGRNSRLVYINNGTDSLPDHIDSLVYRFRFGHSVQGRPREFRATAYIYVLEEIHGASTCRNRPFTATLRERPAGVEFDWFTVPDTLPANPPAGLSHTFGTMTGDTSMLVQPRKVSDASAPWNRVGGFPPELLSIHAAASPGPMRWTGLRNTDWNNPENWVERVTEAGGQTYERPVSWAPSACSDVVIASGMPGYPELKDSAWCRIITVQDRALLANPHVLHYDSARVELMLKASERDRFVMWSAPLLSMYSGDYHFDDPLTDKPYWGDVYMNYFQQANPHGGGAQANMFTATFGEPGDPLGLGKTFNLRVTSTSLSRNQAWIFPKLETEYYPTGMPPVSTPRPASHRFITDSVRLNASGLFEMPVYGDVAGGNLVQVVNPYLAWLHVDAFLQHNSDRLATSGYLVWNGNVNSGFTAVKFDRLGMRYLYTGPTNFSGLPSPEYVAPLQSFFVAKSPAVTNLTTVKMSPNWTTTRHPGPYVLRASEAESGVLHIRATQGGRTAYTALHFDKQALPTYNSSEDVRALFYDALPFSVYVLTALHEPLAISADGEYRSHTTALGLHLSESGLTTLEFTGLERFGHNVYLIDRERDHPEIDLQATPSYTFTVTKPPGRTVFELNDRFALRMEYTGMRNAPEVSARPKVTVTSGRGVIRVCSFSGRMERIEVYNVLGKQVAVITPHTNRADLPVAGAQTYIVNVRIGGEEIVKKIIVK